MTTRAKDTAGSDWAESLPAYQIDHSYEWNYAHAPSIYELGESIQIPGDWTFCGLPALSPLGIPAGPLLNGKWLLYYAHLGFDILTYKTVRSTERECYSLPNLQPVESAWLQEHSEIRTARIMQENWAISFGMPSKAPSVWQEDVAWTREQLPAGKLLVVSVVATPRPDWSIDQVAQDYADCARMAVEAGADAVELNLSCPNVTTCDGELFRQLGEAELVLESCRSTVGTVPLIAKIGWVQDATQAAEFVDRLGKLLDGVSMVNCIPARVVNPSGQALFGGQTRGIGGDLIRDESINQVQRFAEAARRSDSQVSFIGVGGISTAEHMRQYLLAGAETVQLATAAMRDPMCGLRIKRQVASWMDANDSSVGDQP